MKVRKKEKMDQNEAQNKRCASQGAMLQLGEEHEGSWSVLGQEDGQRMVEGMGLS